MICSWLLWRSGKRGNPRLIENVWTSMHSSWFLRWSGKRGKPKLTKNVRISMFLSRFLWWSGTRGKSRIIWDVCISIYFSWFLRWSEDMQECCVANAQHNRNESNAHQHSHSSDGAAYINNGFVQNKFSKHLYGIRTIVLCISHKIRQEGIQYTSRCSQKQTIRSMNQWSLWQSCYLWTWEEMQNPALRMPGHKKWNLNTSVFLQK